MEYNAISTMTELSAAIFCSHTRQAVAGCLARYLGNHIHVSGLLIYSFDFEAKKVKRISSFINGISQAGPEERIIPDNIIDNWNANIISKDNTSLIAQIGSTSEYSFYAQLFGLLCGLDAGIVCVPFKNNDELVCIFIYSTEREYDTTALALCERMQQPAAHYLMQEGAMITEKNGEVLITEGHYSAFMTMDPDFISGRSQCMNDAVALAQRVAASDTTVLIQGETGSGKEFLANMIHARSRRHDKVLLKLNCAGISESFMEMELFGCEEGAFAGATRVQRGLLEQADGGTIFLDEIAELSPSLQARLQRFLQFKEIRRVGGIRSTRVNLRIIAATRHDLRAMAQRGEFREDLWYRLAVCPIAVPPLRERREDILDMAESLIERKSRELGISPPGLSQEMREKIMAYHWPGNMHELENCIERSLLLCRDSSFSLHLGSETGMGPEVDASLQEQPKRPGVFTTLDDLIAMHIRSVLEHTGWRVSGPKGAAKILGLNPNTLHSKMRKLNIALPKGKASK